MKKSILIEVGIFCSILFFVVQKDYRKNSVSIINLETRQASPQQEKRGSVRHPASAGSVAKEKLVKTAPSSQISFSQEEEKVHTLLKSWGEAGHAKFLKTSDGSLFKVTNVNLNKLTIDRTHILWMAKTLAQSLEIPMSSQFEDMTSHNGRRIQKFSVHQIVQNSLGQSFKIHNASVDFIAHRSDQKVIEIHNRLKKYDTLDILPSLTREEAKQLISNSEKIPLASLTVDAEVVAVVDSEKMLQLATVIHSKESSQPYSYFLSHKTKKIIHIEVDRIF